MRCRLAAFVAILLPAALAAESVEEKGPDGKVRARYTVKDDQKDGPFTEFYPSGAALRKGVYKAGQLHGPATVSYPSGKSLATMTFATGELTGPYTGYDPRGGTAVQAQYKAGKLISFRVGTGKGATQDLADGSPAPPRRYDEMAAALATAALAPLVPKKSDPLVLDQQAALRRLQAYRAVAGVPFEGMELDPDMAAKADAGARLCEKIGRLDHKPKNPGLPEDEYKVGYEGTSHSNLANGGRDLAATVDMYMDDSDPSNIDRVGHRRWCLNPPMLKTGFGRSGKFAAMWSMDRSRADVPEFQYLAWPPPGFVPEGFLKPAHAWHVTLPAKAYQKPEKGAVKVAVYRKADRSPDKPGEALKVSYLNVETGGFGAGPAVIFRADGVTPTAGSRYTVTIEGLKKADGTDGPLTYMVIFVPGP
jgi:hypothetical protein